jgi:hypothetical protein
MTDGQATSKAYAQQKRISSVQNTKFLHFFIICSSLFRLLIRIWPIPDPGSGVKKSRIPDPQHMILHMLTIVNPKLKLIK